MKKIIIVISSFLFMLASFAFLLNEKSIEKTHSRHSAEKVVNKLSYQ
jgi:hypothetical protein